MVKIFFPNFQSQIIDGIISKYNNKMLYSKAYNMFASLMFIQNQSLLSR